MAPTIAEGPGWPDCLHFYTLICIPCGGLLRRASGISGCRSVRCNCLVRNAVPAEGWDVQGTVAEIAGDSQRTVRGVRLKSRCSSKAGAIAGTASLLAESSRRRESAGPRRSEPSGTRSPRIEKRVRGSRCANCCSGCGWPTPAGASRHVRADAGAQPARRVAGPSLLSMTISRISWAAPHELDSFEWDD